MTESPRVDAALPPVPTGTHPWVAQWQDRIGFGVSVFPNHLTGRVSSDWCNGSSRWASTPTGATTTAANADCWTALDGLAVSTERIRLGTMVDRIYYRPYLLARQAADVDRASHGAPRPRPRHRAAGGGVRGHGSIVPTNAHRPTGPWRRPSPFCEDYGLGSYSATAARVSLPRPQDRGAPSCPRCRSRTFPSCWPAAGRRRPLRQVARFADAANMGAHPAIGQAVSDDDIVRKFTTLKAWCEEYGRPYESILRTHFTMPLVLAPTPGAGDEAGEDAARHAGLGGRCPLRRHTGRGHHLLPRACRARVPVLHHQPPGWRRGDRRATRD